jgi:hypothetical protein
MGALVAADPKLLRFKELANTALPRLCRLGCWQTASRHG